MKNNITRQQYKQVSRLLKRHSRRFPQCAKDNAEILVDYVALRNLCSELIGIDTEEQKQARIACQSTLAGHTENSPETYGTSYHEMCNKYNQLFTITAPNGDCQAEPDEMGQVIIATTTGTNGEKNALNVNLERLNAILENVPSLEPTEIFGKEKDCN